MHYILVFIYAVSLSSFNIAPTRAATIHDGYAMTLYGEPKYAKGFKHTEYVSPEAPKGGAIKLAEQGTFDSLNPYILKGVKAPNIYILFETLMKRSLDEPMTMYPSVASSAHINEDGTSASFTMNSNAKWHDGEAITAADVVFSFETLRDKGDPTYALYYTPIEKVVAKGNRVTFHFVDGTNPELPFVAATMPILPKHYYETTPFDKTTLEPPLGSGPYKVKSVDAGRSIVYQRAENWWAANLPINKGQYNFDSIQYDMYRDGNVSLEAFKAGNYDFRREYIARNWATAYDSPALKEGKFIKRDLYHTIPQGMQAFVFNLRQPEFSDRRVRKAVSLSMDFEWLNKTIFYNAYNRNTSFFGNTDFAAMDLPNGAEKELLEPFASELDSTIFDEPVIAPNTNSPRKNLLKAQALLGEAGYEVKDGKRVHSETDKPLNVEFLLRQPTMERVIGPMRKNLERLGITSNIRLVDDAQYKQRLDNFDFDIISTWLNNGVFFPGNEQSLYWNSNAANVKGSNNITGLNSKAVDAMLEQILQAKDLKALTPASRALDRILLSEHVAIPHWHSQSFRIAYWDKFAMPKTNPSYDIGLFTWWVKDRN